MASKNTQGTFPEIIKGFSPEVQAIAKSLRSLIVDLHPKKVEITWPAMRITSFGVGPKKMSQHYAYIALHKAHVNLGFYHGAALPKAAQLLEGSGKNLRHIKLRSVADTKSPTIKTLVKSAIRDRQKANA